MKYTKTHAAVCGLYCPSCSIFIVDPQEDPKRLDYIAKQFGSTVEDIKCYGCRSHKRIPYCDTCEMYPCAQEKGIDFCGECDEYSCEKLKDFQAAGAHRFELWNSHEQIVKEGYEKWMDDMLKYYSCPNCGTTNSAYDPKCRKCEHQPSNQYTNNYGQEIVEFLENTRSQSKKK